jgi:hypothetical protein
MAPTLPSDMARKSVAVLLERVERQGAFSPDEGRELIAGCEIVFIVLEKQWVLIQGLLDRGTEGSKLTVRLKELVNVLELGAKAFGVARDQVTAADLASQEKADGLDALERAARRVADMRSEASALLSWLETPFREIDPMSLPEGIGEREAEGYITLDDLTARLLSGKDA